MHHIQKYRYRWLVGLGVLCVAGAGVAQAQEDQATQGTQGLGSATTGMSKPKVCELTGVRLGFTVSSSELDPIARASLDDVAQWLQGDPDRSVRIDGYADPSGSDSFNQVLSEKRAQSAKEYLISKGAPADKIQVFGHGVKEVPPGDFAAARIVAVSHCEPLPQAMGAPEQPAPPAQPSVVVVNPPPEPAAEAPKDTVASRIGLEAQVGGGVTQFWNKGTRALTEAGGSWDARLAIGSRSYIGGEVAYVGSAQNITALGLDSNAIMLGNGAEGDLRVNFTKAKIQPYIFGGVGYMNYQIRNTVATNADLTTNDNILEVPFGAGLSVRPGRAFFLDVRGTGRVTYFDSMFTRAANVVGGNNVGLNSWNAGAHLGWEF
jgi:hypothetical protein